MTIGRKATIVGASANVAVSGPAQKEGRRIIFLECLKLAVPPTFVALLLCTAYVYLRNLM